MAKFCPMNLPRGNASFELRLFVSLTMELDYLVEEVYLYMTKKTYPNGCLLNRKRQIRKKAEKFEIVDGELYHAPMNKQV